METLIRLKTDIEKMNKYQQTDILRILHNNNVTLNENKSGVFVNLSTVDDTIIEKLDKQIAYIVEQEHNIQAAEYQKEEYKTYLTNDKEDKEFVNYTIE
jgi:formiminotetrahydrofolate cyclodeaminase|tara:strand:- start:162 stop:458 length:297 start_codon:yes stop_codon:yes gene_type:complete